MKKIMLVILDGFGYREEKENNAVLNANLSNYMSLWDNYPHTTLFASEEPIGLQEGQFGNSEIGHMTIGAGKIIKDNISNVNEMFKDINNNEDFDDMIRRLNQTGKPLHLIGLYSDGNVHSSLTHWTKMLEVLRKKITNPIYIHAITDGRDTNEKHSRNYLKYLDSQLEQIPNAKLASICGRYYAMDRDKNWDRTKLFYDSITKGLAISSSDVYDAIGKFYDNGVTDEFLKPVILNKEGIINDGDTIMWMNFREDRALQILNALSNPTFDEFKTKPMSDLKVYSFLPFDEPIHTKNFTKYDTINDPLGVYLSKLGLSQARIAETEKFAHVTFFFDGQNEEKMNNCDKFLIPSPKVATYDLKPEMSAIEVTKKVMSCLDKDYDFIVVNYANPDMVGHTGNYEATLKACSAVDICLGKIVETAFDNFYKVIIVADHGNADIMKNEDGSACTTHTISKVPFIITDPNVELKNGGNLSMIAPTILDYMDIARPTDMQNTESLLK